MAGTAMAPAHAHAVAGALLGTVVGDAIGLPREGLMRARAARLHGGAPLRHRLLFGRGLMSDDGEHACMTAQALIASGGSAARFARSLGWRLRGWLLGLPAGIGFGTLRAILKLWLGVPPGRSGVASAGSGPCMRAPVLGAWAAADAARLQALVDASTRATHTHPLAVAGAALVARAAGVAARHGPAGLIEPTLALLADPALPEPLRGACARIPEALGQGAPADEFAAQIGCGTGVSGWVAHTVPAALYCHLRHAGDYRAAVEAAVLLGGDADTVGAVTGGLAGAAVGATGIPAPWVEGLIDWPRSAAWVRRLAERLATTAPGTPGTPLPLFWPGLAIRNPAFLAVVLLHGFRRLWPPY